MSAPFRTGLLLVVLLLLLLQLCAASTTEAAGFDAHLLTLDCDAAGVQLWPNATDLVLDRPGQGLRAVGCVLPRVIVRLASADRVAASQATPGGAQQQGANITSTGWGRSITLERCNVTAGIVVEQTMMDRAVAVPGNRSEPCRVNVKASFVDEDASGDRGRASVTCRIVLDRVRLSSAHPPGPLSIIVGNDTTLVAGLASYGCVFNGSDSGLSLEGVAILKPAASLYQSYSSLSTSYHPNRVFFGSMGVLVFDESSFVDGARWIVRDTAVVDGLYVMLGPRCAATNATVELSNVTASRIILGAGGNLLGPPHISDGTVVICRDCLSGTSSVDPAVRRFGGGGGGRLRRFVFGGTSPADASMYLQLTNTVGISLDVETVTIRQLQILQSTVSSATVRNSAVAPSTSVVFEDCTFLNQTNGYVDALHFEAVAFGASSSLVFDDCRELPVIVASGVDFIGTSTTTSSSSAAAGGFFIRGSSFAGVASIYTAYLAFWMTEQRNTVHYTNYSLLMRASTFRDGAMFCVSGSRLASNIAATDGTRFANASSMAVSDTTFATGGVFLFDGRKWAATQFVNASNFVVWRCAFVSAGVLRGPAIVSDDGMSGVFVWLRDGSNLTRLELVGGNVAALQCRKCTFAEGVSLTDVTLRNMSADLRGSDVSMSEVLVGSGAVLTNGTRLLLAGSRLAVLRVWDATVDNGSSIVASNVDMSIDRGRADHHVLRMFRYYHSLVSTTSNTNLEPVYGGLVIFNSRILGRSAVAVWGTGVSDRSVLYVTGTVSNDSVIVVEELDPERTAPLPYTASSLSSFKLSFVGILAVGGPRMWTNYSQVRLLSAGYVYLAIQNTSGFNATDGRSSLVTQCSPNSQATVAAPSPIAEFVGQLRSAAEFRPCRNETLVGIGAQGGGSVVTARDWALHRWPDVLAVPTSSAQGPPPVHPPASALACVAVEPLPPDTAATATMSASNLPSRSVTTTRAPRERRGSSASPTNDAAVVAPSPLDHSASRTPLLPYRQHRTRVYTTHSRTEVSSDIGSTPLLQHRSSTVTDVAAGSDASSAAAAATAAKSTKIVAVASWTSATAGASAAAAGFVSPSATTNTGKLAALYGVAQCANSAVDPEPERLALPIQMAVGSGVLAMWVGSLLLSSAVVAGVTLVAMLMWLQRRRSWKAGRIGVHGGTSTSIDGAGSNVFGFGSRACFSASMVTTAYLGPNVVGASMLVLTAPGGAYGAAVVAGSIGIALGVGACAATAWLCFSAPAHMKVVFRRCPNNNNPATDEAHVSGKFDLADTSDLFLATSLGPVIDPCRNFAQLRTRLVTAEELTVATVLAAAGGLRLGDAAACSVAGVSTIVVTVAHVGYLAVVRPYARRIDAVFQFVIALLLLAVSISGYVVTTEAADGSGSGQSTAASAAGILAAVAEISFFVQAFASVGWLGWLRWRRRRRATDIHPEDDRPEPASKAAPLLKFPVEPALTPPPSNASPRAAAVAAAGRGGNGTSSGTPFNSDDEQPRSSDTAHATPPHPPPQPRNPLHREV